MCGWVCWLLGGVRGSPHVQDCGCSKGIVLGGLRCKIGTQWHLGILMFDIMIWQTPLQTPHLEVLYENDHMVSTSSTLYAEPQFWLPHLVKVSERKGYRIFSMSHVAGLGVY